MCGSDTCGWPSPLTALAYLVEKYMAAISSGSVPCVESTLKALAQAENTAAVQVAVAEYQRGMEQGLVLPTASYDALLAVHRDCEQRALALFLSRAFADHKHQYHDELVVSCCHAVGFWRHGWALEH